MSVDGKQISLDIAGLGIIFYSPRSASHIPEGADYFASNYQTDQQVQAHIQNGSIVGFCTGTSGQFRIAFYDGYPSDDLIRDSEFKLRLGLHCEDGVVCFRDLYDLMDWRSECPAGQTLELSNGLYHVTLCSNAPESGILGDNQQIDFYLQPLDAFPRLSKVGVPTLCS